jgi:hypothetical protein
VLLPTVTALELRFWDKVEIVPGKCWPWKGTINKKTGYGGFRVGKKRVLSHRHAYMLIKGEIPPDMTIDHNRDAGCVTRACCNPDHLRPLTRGENVLIGTGHAAKNLLKTHCPRGHKYDITLRNGHRACRRCRRARNAAVFHTRAKPVAI